MCDSDGLIDESQAASWTTSWGFVVSRPTLDNLLGDSGLNVRGSIEEN